jgi:hypothetical protein
MATHTTTTDYAKEKQEVHYVEDARDLPSDSSLELQKELTLQGVDMNNTAAVKGDDSDGKVEWNARSMMAAVFLAALYTGPLTEQPALFFPCLTENRFSSHSILHGRLSWLYRRRSRSRPWLRMATYGKHPRHRGCCPVRWLPPRPVRQALHCLVRLTLHLRRLCSRWVWTQLRAIARWYGHLWYRRCDR